jgi:glycosyltransferase involved in cell wall biosynthesis
MTHVLVLAGYAPSLVNFRGPLLAAMVTRGWRVTAAGPQMDKATRDGLLALGAAPVEVAAARAGMNPLADLAYRDALIRLLRTERPDVVLAYTAKPVIWGTLAAKATGIPRVVAMVTGLGYAFTPPGRLDPRHAVASLAARALYRLALPRADHVLFQNPDDRDLFARLGFTPPAGRVEVIAGSGIDLTQYTPSPPPARLSFLMLARLLRAKGVVEYAEAARRLKARYPEVEFRLAGPFDPSPDGVRPAEVERWVSGGLTFLGTLADVRPALAEAAVYVLPSYREGTPRSVLEALAMGRAVITTDAPGCRETVQDGANGFLVTPRDVNSLLVAMEHFILHPSQARTMGASSLELARSKYDVRLVNDRVIAAISPGDVSGAEGGIAIGCD